MKKLYFLLLTAVLVVLPSTAQIKKTWDFTLGLSEETQNDLNADATNWASNGTDADGNTNAWKDAKKIYGVLTANGNVIKELLGISFGSAGLSNGNNIHLGPNKIRLTRKNMEVNFPKLANGQKLTIVARSANSTATDRGFKAKYDYMKYIEGPEDGICLGGAGNQTLVWQIETDSPDSVAVGVVLTPDGGLDISSFMIDNGDEPEIPENLNIAYLYDSTYNIGKTNAYCGIDNDPIFNNTKLAEQNTTAINIAKFTADDTDTLNALQNYDLVVISEAMASGQKFAIACKQLINRVPILNFKSFIYKTGCWGVGAGVNPTAKAANDGGIATIAVSAAFREDDLFKDIELESDSLITLFNNYEPETVKSNLVQGYTLSAGSLFEGDDVIAKVYKDSVATNAIHRHGTKNMYMLIPISSDAMFIEDESNLSDNCITLINNAVDMVAATKSKVTPCSAPSISQVNGDMVTTVTIKCGTTGAAVYYTTDGTDPTEASTLYSEPFDVTADSTLVKAIAMKQGNDNSSISKSYIRVYAKPGTPTFSLVKEDGKTTVTIETATAGATIYYNFVNSTETTKSAVYSAPIEIDRPCTLYAYAQAGAVISDLSEQVIEIQGVDPADWRNHEFAHFNAAKDNWWWTTSGGGDKVAYYMGKKAMSMYTSIDTVIVGTDTTIVKTPRDLMVWYAKNDSANTYDDGWKLFSMGQEIHWESQSPVQQVGKAGDAGYYCDKPEDLLMPVTAGFICLNGCYTGEGFNAGIQSTQKFQGPFDIVACVGNNNSDGASLTVALAVSEDGENWTAVDTIGMSYYKRFWTTKRVAYNEAKEVYVRVMQGGGGTKIAVYDIILFNNKPDAMERTISSDIIATEYYNLSGMRLSAPAEGVTIVKYIHADGQVSAEKVIIK